MNRPNHISPLQFRAGDLVEVKSKEEILATLDGSGSFAGLPFMPEMLGYCGKVFRVYKRADKTCDTIGKTGSRRMEDAVHLEGARCDGAGHGSCQANCLIFWKEAWLKPVRRASDEPPLVNETISPRLKDHGLAKRQEASCSEGTVMKAAVRVAAKTYSKVKYSCQATELLKATSYLAWWDVRQYIRDLKSRNITARQLIRGASLALFNMAVRNSWRSLMLVKSLTVLHGVMETESAHLSTFAVMASTKGLNINHGGLKDTVKALVRARWVEYPHIEGRLKHTPSAVLNLQPGELVQVKSRAEILETLDTNNKNRGLRFDVEMVPYCGGVFRVLRRVEQIIDERTGRMLRFPNDCIMLEGVVCKACYSDKRLFCPRSIYSYWREIWLKRIDSPGQRNI